MGTHAAKKTSRAARVRKSRNESPNLLRDEGAFRSGRISTDAARSAPVVCSTLVGLGRVVDPPLRREAVRGRPEALGRASRATLKGRRVDELDRILSRAWAIGLEDLSDENEAEIDALLPALVAAGYAAIDGESPTGYFWRFTPEGVQRVEALGLDADDE